MFVSPGKSVEWRQWDFWLPFPDFNYAHFQLHWTVLRWASLNPVSAFISHWKPWLILLPGPAPAAEWVLGFVNRDEDRTTLELIAFKYYFYLIKKFFCFLSFFLFLLLRASVSCSEVNSVVYYRNPRLSRFANSNLTASREQLLSETAGSLSGL